VGLPTDADMGNSEVGHNALGSGQVVDQGTLFCLFCSRCFVPRNLCTCVPLSLLYGAGARLVDIGLEDGSIFKSDGWKYIESTFEKGTVHFIGLASDGGVHSRLDQVSNAPVHDCCDCPRDVPCVDFGSATWLHCCFAVLLAMMLIDDHD
jgi:2,3-bisphosphoglycerate-independent phosphoglycerate mutase